MKAVITEIGTQALGGSEPILILFGEGATPALREYSVIQKLEEAGTFDLTKGDQLIIDGAEYEITYVGSFANANLTSISHVTLVFDKVPETDPIVNALYLSSKGVPEIKIGTKIEYKAAKN